VHKYTAIDKHHGENIAWNASNVYRISFLAYLIWISNLRENQRVVKILGGIIVLKPVLVARQSPFNRNRMVKARIEVPVEQKGNR